MAVAPCAGRASLFGTDAIVGRTGYTGEDGVELYLDGGVVEVWTGLLELADDLLDRSLRNPDALRDVAKPSVGFLGEADQNVRVVAEVGPVACVAHFGPPMPRRVDPLRARGPRMEP